MTPEAASFALDHYAAPKALATYGNPAAAWAWLDRCHNTTFAHGSELVLALGTPGKGKSGISDNGYYAEQILLAFESLGWIRRTGPATPSKEQRFFGVGGLSNASKSSSPIVFGFEPVRGCPEKLAWIRANKPA
jgi:hypothetical protein